LVAKPDRDDSHYSRSARASAAAGARVPEKSEVALQTVRLVAAPNVIELSIVAKRRNAVSDAGLQLGDCEVNLGSAALPGAWSPW
jgi:hypothetical protein